jgi:enoyl-CoA hydratase/carnithine racemase
MADAAARTEKATNATVAHLKFAPTQTLDSLRETLTAVFESGEANVVVLEVQPRGDASSDLALEWLERFELPIVAWFEGHLAGDAASVALASDVRVCGADAALVPPPASDERLRRLVRDPRATRLAERDGTFSAEELFEFGLVGAIQPAGRAHVEAERLASVMATRGPIALRLGKEAIWRGLEMPLEQALRFETDLTLLLQTTKDRAEGVRAFLEKREPRFTGD